MAELETAESWEEARNLAIRIGNVPSSLTTCMRYIRTDAENKLPVLGKTARYCLLRLTKSASFKAPIYYAAATFKPDKLVERATLTDSALVDIFAPDEILVILALEYLYRKIKKICHPDEWKYIDAVLLPQVDLGGMLGKIIPAIGMPRGLLASGMRHLASGMFLAVNKNEYIKYRRHLKSQGLGFDSEYEMSTWGCTHAQVASLICQPLGLGPTIGGAVARGLVSHLQSDNPLPDDVMAMRVACIWIDSVYKTGKTPSIGLRPEFYPQKKDVDQILSIGQEMSTTGSKLRWLDRDKDDISAELTPALFPAGVAPAPETLEIPTPEELTEEVLSQISDEELKKLEGGD